jgi:hypothetical protein
MKRIKFKPKMNADKPIPVAAVTHGCLCVHRTIPSGKTWTVSHIPSGLALRSYLRKRASAVLIARTFGDRPDLAAFESLSRAEQAAIANELRDFYAANELE